MKLHRIVLIGGPFDGLELSAKEPLLQYFEIRGTLLRGFAYYDLADKFENMYGVYRRSRRKSGITRYRFECLKPFEKTRV